MLVLDVKMLEESSDFYLSDSSSTGSSITTVLTNNSIDDQPDGNAHLGLIGISPSTAGLTSPSLTTMTTTLHPLGICHQRQQHQHHHPPPQPPPPLPTQMQAASPVHLHCLSSIGVPTTTTTAHSNGTTIPQQPDLQLHSPQSVASSSSSLSSVGSYNNGIGSTIISDNMSVAHNPSSIMRAPNGGGDNCIDTMAADSSTGMLKGESECNNNNANTVNCNGSATTNSSNGQNKEGGGSGGRSGGGDAMKKKNPVGRRKLILSAREKTLRRLESNERERLRMHSLNQAFQVYILLSYPIVWLNTRVFSLFYLSIFFIHFYMPIQFSFIFIIIKWAWQVLTR